MLNEQILNEGVLIEYKHSWVLVVEGHLVKPGRVELVEHQPKMNVVEEQAVTVEERNQLPYLEVVEEHPTLLEG